MTSGSEEEGLRKKQLKARSKAVNSKSSSLVTCQIKSFKSITKLSLVVKNGSIKGKLNGAEVDMEGLAIKSSSEEEMMGPRPLYRQLQAIREIRNWNSWIKEEHLVRIGNQARMVERTVHVPRIFGQRGAERDGGLLRNEKASEKEEEEILEKLGRAINCGSRGEGSEDNADESKIYWKARQRKYEEQDGNRQPNNPVNHDVQDNSISSSSQSNLKMRFDQLKENMMSGLEIVWKRN
ncbi:hypothetical protein BY996DRAFT_6525895 [Phakopsora pachyrhizi]|nr:hypothetical protein BY996DRAFT_6525895 [Phakopsora pachyrhizi]